MADTDLRQLTTTGMNTAIQNFSVSSKIIDEAGKNGITYWEFKDYTKNNGYYKTIPELKKSVDALAMHTVGKGWTADARTKVILEHITGWGKETFRKICWNLIVTKKVNGDAFAEIVMKDDVLINLKVLSPSNVQIGVNTQGRIDHYLVLKGTEWTKVAPEKILHLSNDRIANEIHGTSFIEACKWVIDARNEAMSDKRRTLHRMTIRVMEVDAHDTTTMARVKTEYAEAINKGEVLVVPKGNVGFPDVPTMSTQEHSEWIRYLESFFYKAVGVSEAILGGTQDFTEAAAKTGILTFEQPYLTEQRELEEELWSQLGIKVTFYRPTSLQQEMQASEAANTGQVSIQPNEGQI